MAIEEGHPAHLQQPFGAHRFAGSAVDQIGRNVEAKGRDAGGGVQLAQYLIRRQLIQYEPGWVAQYDTVAGALPVLDGAPVHQPVNELFEGL